MSKVAVVTDSTAYIPKDLVDKHKITVAAQILIWEGETLRDDIDIHPTEFYTRLTKADVMPTTSQATPADFKVIYEKLHDEGKDILAILVSDQLSKTVNSADLAHQMVPKARVEIINSATTAMELGFHVLAAARAAENGASIDECTAIAREAQSKSGVLFAVDTLEFLHRGGRIGGASRFLGTALQLKPILELTGGRIEPIERVRTKRKAHERLTEMIIDRVKGKDNIRLASLNANAAEDAKALIQEILKEVKPVEIVHSEVSPVVGAHVGPGTIGVAYITD